MSRTQRRVVISGLGPVTPVGVGIDAMWEKSCEGGSAISRIEAFDASGFRSRHGGTDASGSTAALPLHLPLLPPELLVPEVLS